MVEAPVYSTNSSADGHQSLGSIEGGGEPYLTGFNRHDSLCEHSFGVDSVRLAWLRDGQNSLDMLILGEVDDLS